MPLDALPAVCVPAPIHHVRPLFLQVVLLEAQYALQVIVKVLDLEDLGTLLLWIGQVFAEAGVEAGALGGRDHHFDLLSIAIFRVFTRQHRENLRSLIPVIFPAFFALRRCT